MLLTSLCLELTILLAFWLALGVWRQERPTPARATFAALGAAAILWCLGEVTVLRGVLDEVQADRLRYAGILTLPPLWAGLAGHLSRIELARRVPWFPLILAAPMAIPFGLLFSERWSGLFMTTVPGEVDLYGPLWWVSLGYGYVLVLSGTGMLIWTALRDRRGGPALRRLAIGASALVPLAGNAWFVSTGLTAPVDPTPMLFGVSLLVLRSALFRGDLLDTLPVSQHALIEQLPVGVILTDRHGVVLDLNPAAEHRLGVSEAAAVGRSLDAVLSAAGEAVRADVTPVFSGDREAGQLVLIDPPEKEEARA